MAIRDLKAKSINANEKDISKFIDKGAQTQSELSNELDHRITLRLPKWVIERIDKVRAKRVGKISRNSIIVEFIVTGIEKSGYV